MENGTLVVESVCEMGGKRHTASTTTAGTTLLCPTTKKERSNSQRQRPPRRRKHKKKSQSHLTTMTTEQTPPKPANQFGLNDNAHQVEDFLQHHPHPIKQSNITKTLIPPCRIRDRSSNNNDNDDTTNGWEIRENRTVYDCPDHKHDRNTPEKSERDQDDHNQHRQMRGYSQLDDSQDEDEDQEDNNNNHDVIPEEEEEEQEDNVVTPRMQEVLKKGNARRVNRRTGDEEDLRASLLTMMGNHNNMINRSSSRTLTTLGSKHNTLSVMTDSTYPSSGGFASVMDEALNTSAGSLSLDLFQGSSQGGGGAAGATPFMRALVEELDNEGFLQRHREYIVNHNNRGLNGMALPEEESHEMEDGELQRSHKSPRAKDTNEKKQSLEVNDSPQGIMDSNDKKKKKNEQDALYNLTNFADDSGSGSDDENLSKSVASAYEDFLQRELSPRRGGGGGGTPKRKKKKERTAVRKEDDKQFDMPDDLYFREIVVTPQDANDASTLGDSIFYSVDDDDYDDEELRQLEHERRRFGHHHHHHPIPRPGWQQQQHQRRMSMSPYNNNNNNSMPHHDVFRYGPSVRPSPPPLPTQHAQSNNNNNKSSSERRESLMARSPLTTVHDQDSAFWQDYDNMRQETEERQREFQRLQQQREEYMYYQHLQQQALIQHFHHHMYVQQQQQQQHQQQQHQQQQQQLHQSQRFVNRFSTPPPRWTGGRPEMGFAGSPCFGNSGFGDRQSPMSSSYHGYSHQQQYPPQQSSPYSQNLMAPRPPPRRPMMPPGSQQQPPQHHHHPSQPPPPQQKTPPRLSSTIPLAPKSIHWMPATLSIDEQNCVNALKSRWEARKSRSTRQRFTDEWYLRFARCSPGRPFHFPSAWKVMCNFSLRYLDLNIVGMERQLLTRTLFPIKGLQSCEGHEMFYMRPCRYSPRKEPIDVVIDNLVYVMNGMLEEEHNARNGIGVVANMAGWKMSNFSVAYCHRLLMTLQGRRVPTKVQLFLIYNPPPWFGNIWAIMRTMMSDSFRRKVRIVHGMKDLSRYMRRGFHNYLPDDMLPTRGQSTQAILREYISRRKRIESNRILHSSPTLVDTTTTTTTTSPSTTTGRTSTPPITPPIR